MIHWQIQDFGKKSSITGRDFKDGSEIVCLLYKNTSDGELLRIDLEKAEYDQLIEEDDLILLGKWSRIYSYKRKMVSKEERKLSAESLFISLYDSEIDSEMCSDSFKERNLLKYLFALSLERNRILKSMPLNKNVLNQDFVHIKTKQVFNVPIENINRDNVAKIEAAIGDLLV